jgi:hypothetical protein
MENCCRSEPPEEQFESEEMRLQIEGRMCWGLWDTGIGCMGRCLVRKEEEMFFAAYSDDQKIAGPQVKAKPGEERRVFVEASESAAAEIAP